MTTIALYIQIVYTVMEFEWDEVKRISNIEKHTIDFRHAIDVFIGFTVTRPSRRAGEQRFLAVGE